MSTKIKTFILQTKFNDHELSKLKEDLSDRAVCEIVEDASMADCIVTCLHQSVRVIRELHKLNLRRIVRVLQIDYSAAYFDALSSDAEAASQLWLVYKPGIRVSPHQEAHVQATGSLALALTSRRLATPSASASTPHLTRLTTLTEAVGETTLPGLKHEMSQDPDSNHHAAVQIKTDQGKFSCQRYTPLICKNEGLVDALQKLKLARTLQEDKIGIRAYSTVVASIRAYPVRIMDAQEISHLEGCGPKIVNIVNEYLTYGKIQEAEDVWMEDDIRTKYHFWQVHGVGPATAREWYEKGWRDINDAIHSEWDTLPRAVQIGLKYYDRSEVEHIASIVHGAAVEVAVASGGTNAVHSTICGGYRRGKQQSGDVDIVLTHESCHGFTDMMKPLIRRLEIIGLLDQEIIASRHDDIGQAVSTALVVIKLPPPWPQHKRRLDIIVAHPAQYISAIVGWTGATTFERDLRLHAVKQKSWKFDSTGLTRDDERIRDERIEWAPGRDAVDLERNFFKLLDLAYVPPEGRNTG